MTNGTARGKKQNSGKTVTLEQLADIEVRGGKTVTTLYPPTEEMVEEAKTMEPPPTLVYRRFYFRRGVPKEYHWVTDVPSRRANGGAALQRIALADWYLVIEEEKRSGDGHLRACRIMPRPADRGGCACRACESARQRLEQD